MWAEIRDEAERLGEIAVPLDNPLRAPVSSWGDTLDP